MLTVSQLGFVIRELSFQLLDRVVDAFVQIKPLDLREERLRVIHVHNDFDLDRVIDFIGDDIDLLDPIEISR